MMGGATGARGGVAHPASSISMTTINQRRFKIAVPKVGSQRDVQCSRAP